MTTRRHLPLLEAHILCSNCFPSALLNC